MVPLHSPKDYLFNLHTSSKSEAKRLWRQNIKDAWNHECAYCESKDDITLDHVIPQCKGGLDIKTNVIACCHSCNQSKGHIPWKEWYSNQLFFTEEKKNAIIDWMKDPQQEILYRYCQRRNNAS
jgi:hypothetical protein